MTEKAKAKKSKAEKPGKKGPETGTPKKTEPVVKQKTLKERLNETVDKHYKEREELKKQLFSLMQRVLYPEQFCPECDERLFFTPSNGGYSCPNCGYVATATVTALIQPVSPQARVVQDGNVSPQVENAIKESNAAMKEPRRVVAPTAIGDKIRKLVDGRESTAPTQADESAVRRNPAVKGPINWC